ncbi:MAG: 4Fe-4S binding protein [Parasporobacterium sp.]|nr:4Fe-4S binding protein [Parasporobacterium sp.]
MIRKPREINEQTPWQELTVGGEIAEGGTSAATMTGEWRSNRPVWVWDKCKQCLLCAPFCPDSSIPVKDGKRMAFDYDHCKGCGICYKICPFSAIEFIKEGEQA